MAPDPAHDRVFRAFVAHGAGRRLEPVGGALLAAGMRAAGLVEVAGSSWFREVAGGRCAA